MRRPSLMIILRYQAECVEGRYGDDRCRREPPPIPFFLIVQFLCRVHLTATLVSTTK
jgi:hypothetical protein